MHEDKENVELQQTQVSPNPKSTNPMLYWGIAIVLLVVVGTFLVKRLGKQATTSASSQESVQGVKSSVTEPTIVGDEVAVENNSQVQTINIEAGSFYYNPKEVKVKKGQTVQVILSAKDMMHDFNIDELAVDGEVIKAGETTTINFVADKVGTFEYYCSVGQHRKMGQIGKLIVEE